jgi:hypothetical protein
MSLQRKLHYNTLKAAISSNKTKTDTTRRASVPTDPKLI